MLVEFALQLFSISVFWIVKSINWQGYLGLILKRCHDLYSILIYYQDKNINTVELVQSLITSLIENESIMLQFVIKRDNDKYISNLEREILVMVKFRHLCMLGSM